MKITLETVRKTLKEALGFESFIAGFIREVREDTEHPSAGITQDGLLCYNPDFIKRYIDTQEDIFCLVFHEVLHPVFGHFVYEHGEIENIAMDAVINAVISTLYREESGAGRLFRKTYREHGLEGLLRPGSRLQNSRYCNTHNTLYGLSQSQEITTGELIQTLKILTPRIEVKVALLGTHGREGSQEPKAWPQEALSQLAEEIRKNAADRAGCLPGHSQLLVQILMESLRTHLTMKRALLERFLTQRKVDKFKELFRERRISVSPIPLRPSKRDLILIAAGISPCTYHNEISSQGERERGLAVYLDVSGSVNDHLPRILGILRGFRREITSIFQFSNHVVETRFESLLKGDIQTTYGTDFDCIAQSILERNFDKAIVITDGYASMADDLKEHLQKAHLKALTILFGSGRKCMEWEVFGDVVSLEDITQ